MVEVVEAEDTSEETVQAAVDFCSRIGKQPLRCLDGPGFAVGRVLGALLSEAWRVEHEGMDAAEVDERVEAAGLLPSGPFRLAERLGPRTRCAPASTCATRSARASMCRRRSSAWGGATDDALRGPVRRRAGSGALRVSLLAGTPAEPAQGALEK